MKLIRDELRHHATTIAATFFGMIRIPSKHWFNEEYVLPKLYDQTMVWAYRDAIDGTVTNFLAKRAKTFIFPTKTVLDLPLHTPLEPGHYIAPFPEMIFQFTEPILESSVGLTGAIPSGKEYKDDSLLGLVIGWPPESGGGPFYNHTDLINVIGYYSSTSFNRAVLYNDGNGEVDYTKAVGGYVPGGKEDKQILVNIALWCISYLNSPGVEIERVAGANPQVNAKRERQGKRKIEEHYILRVKNDKIHYLQREATREGSKHSYQYDVKSHPRRLPTGKVIIIPAHRRGLDNTEYRPKIRVVP